MSESLRLVYCHLTWNVIIFIFIYIYILTMENDRFTTTLQQVHNTPSHGVEPNVWGPPHVRGCYALIVVMLCMNQISLTI